MSAPMPAAPPVAPAEIDDPFNADRFLLRQKLLTINQKYAVFNEQGTPVLFVERPTHVVRSALAMFAAIAGFLIVAGAMLALTAMLDKSLPWFVPVGLILALVLGTGTAVVLAVLISPKRHLHFYPDETKSRRLLGVRQDFKFAIVNARYTVLDASGAPLAVFVKNYLMHVVRRHWRVENPDGSLLCEALEDSWFKAILRRVLGPMYGLLRTNFIIVEAGTGRTLGTFNRTFTILDRYVLDVSQDPGVTIDRRVALALGVMLDTGEGR